MQYFLLIRKNRFIQAVTIGVLRKGANLESAVQKTFLSFFFLLYAYVFSYIKLCAQHMSIEKIPINVGNFRVHA